MSRTVKYLFTVLVMSAMKNWKYLIGVVLFLSYTGASHAVESKMESWYTYWELGYANISYPVELQEAIDVLENFPGVDRTKVNIGILGFYWPLKNNRTLLGGMIDGCADRFDVSLLGYSTYMQINHYLYSFSVMHFLNNTVGNGFFLRSDVGFAKMMVDKKDEGDRTSDWGMGFLVGGGYSLPVTEGTRIIINANYSIKRVEEENYGKFAISIGGLF